MRAKVLGRNRITGSATGAERGEALVVRLPEGRHLFVVIDRSKPREEKVFFPEDWVLDGARKLHTVKGQPREVPPKRYPLMVTFGDRMNPATVQEVDPFNLPATFEEGYRIKSYIVEITDEPVTVGGHRRTVALAGTVS
jgi:hypothetical protein